MRTSTQTGTRTKTGVPLSSARVARGVKFYCDVTVRRAMLISIARCSGGFRGGHDGLLELRSVFPRLVSHLKGKRAAAGELISLLYPLSQSFLSAVVSEKLNPSAVPR